MKAHPCSRVCAGVHSYSTPRELLKLIGGEDRLVWLDKQGEMDWCLCVVDLPLTLSRASLKWRRSPEAKTFFVE